jgi:threonine dehydratase
LAVAAAKKIIAREGWSGKRVVAINCGANMNFDRLRHVAERAELGEQREALLAVQIPERPGSFLGLCRALGHRSVTEFNYRYDRPDLARVFLGFALANGRVDRDGVSDALPAGVAHEMLLRFEFPERPGALLRFLEAVGTHWNITLFHYRNHGSDTGRVVAGIVVPPETREDFLLHLTALHYPWVDETANPAYRLFLAG